MLTEENLKIIRPSYGLEPKYWELILGKKIRGPVKAGTPLSWDLLI
jgi:N-acetylneuraminate synthase